MVDHSRFEALVERHHAAVWRSAWRILRDQSRAADAVQAVYLELLERNEDLKDAKDPEAVLCWRASRRSLNLLRGDERLLRREEGHAMTRDDLEQPRPDQDFEARELEQRVDAATASLPEALRRAVVLRFQEDLSFRRIGELLGCGEATAHDRVRKGIARLRASLGKAGVVMTVAALERQVAACPVPPAPAGLTPQLLALPTATTAAAGWSMGSLLIAGALAASVVLGGAWLLSDPSTPSAVAATTADWNGSTGDLERRVAFESGPADEIVIGTVPFVPKSGVEEGIASPATSEEAPDGQPPVGIAGRVQTKSGQPLAGVRISVRPYRPGLKSIDELGKIRSGRDGRFFFAEPEGGWTSKELVLFLHAPYYQGRREYRMLAPEQGIKQIEDLVFERDSDAPEGDFRLVLRIRDAAGRPVNRAAVRLDRATGPVAKPGSWVTEAEARSDETGRVELDGKLLGNKRVNIRAPRGLSLPVWQGRYTIDRPGLSEYEIELPVAGHFAGRVLGMGDRLPTDVQITLVPKAGNGPMISTSIRRDHRFRIEGLPREEMIVRVYVSEEGPRDLGVILPPVDDFQVDLNLAPQPERAPGLHGMFRDRQTGEPIVLSEFDYELRYVPAMDARTFREDFAPSFLTQPLIAQRAAINGQIMSSAHFHVLRPRTGHLLIEVRNHAHAIAYAGPFYVDEHTDRKGIEIALEAPSKIKGRVLDQSGQPVADAVVFPVGRGRYSDELVESRKSALPEPGGSHGLRRLEGAGITNAKGEFSIGMLPASMDFRLAIVARGFPALRIDRPALEPGGTTAMHPITLRP